MDKNKINNISKMKKIMSLIEFIIILIIFSVGTYYSKSVTSFYISIASYGLYQLIQIKNNTDK
jgi:capsule polysaccharide export protein KpsE/RkpR